MKVHRSAVLVAPQGFEPRLIESESTVLPLNEGATRGACREDPLTAHGRVYGFRPTGSNSAACYKLSRRSL
jgi:hypothetical protein